jgi:hypothetical protein
MTTKLQSRNGFRGLDSSKMPRSCPGLSSGPAVSSNQRLPSAHVASSKHAPPPWKKTTSLLGSATLLQKVKGPPRAHRVFPPGAIEVHDVPVAGGGGETGDGEAGGGGGAGSGAGGGGGCGSASEPPPQLVSRRPTARAQAARARREKNGPVTSGP